MLLGHLFYLVYEALDNGELRSDALPSDFLFYGPNKLTVLLLQQGNLLLNREEGALACLFHFLEFHPQLLDLLLLYYNDLLVLGLLSGPSLPHFIFFVLHESLVFELKAELIILSLRLHFLLDLLNHAL